MQRHSALLSLLHAVHLGFCAIQVSHHIIHLQFCSELAVCRDLPSIGLALSIFCPECSTLPGELTLIHLGMLLLKLLADEAFRPHRLDLVGLWQDVRQVSGSAQGQKADQDHVGLTP